MVYKTAGLADDEVELALRDAQADVDWRLDEEEESPLPRRASTILWVALLLLACAGAMYVLKTLPGARFISDTPSYHDTLPSDEPPTPPSADSEIVEAADRSLCLACT